MKQLLFRFKILFEKISAQSTRLHHLKKHIYYPKILEKTLKMLDFL